MGIYKRLLNYIKPYKFRLAVVCMFFFAIINAMVSGILYIVINFYGKGHASFWRITGLIKKRWNTKEKRKPLKKRVVDYGLKKKISDRYLLETNGLAFSITQLALQPMP